MAVDSVMEAEEDRKRNGVPENLNILKMKRLLLMTGMGLLFHTAAEAATNMLDGQAIFDRNCTVCHAMNPPPKSAPPIIGVISQYHNKFQMKEDGVNHLVAYLKLPKKQNAVEPQAITRFGLMPPSPLSSAGIGPTGSVGIIGARGWTASDGSAQAERQGAKALQRQEENNR